MTTEPHDGPRIEFRCDCGKHLEMKVRKDADSPETRAQMHYALVHAMATHASEAHGAGVPIR